MRSNKKILLPSPEFCVIVSKLMYEIPANGTCFGFPDQFAAVTRQAEGGIGI